MKLLGCVAFAMRPMKTHELADSVALILPPHRLDGQTKLSETVFGICKPLVEVMPDRTVFRPLHCQRVCKGLLQSLDSRYTDTELAGTFFRLTMAPYSQRSQLRKTWLWLVLSRWVHV